jgi:diketogulonate reductase-like aldo/keto reductase
MKYVTLSSGREMPMIGLGTWEVTGDTAVAAVRTALKLGYRHIDTAEGYRNHRDIARGLAAAGIARDDLFITSKVFRTHLHYDDLLKAAEEALRDLDIPYLDLYLVHWPNPEVPMAETFRALSRLQAEGLVRDIGVSNFSAAQIDEALAASANPISINQVEYHPYLNQEALRAHCEARGVRLTAYSPLGRGNLLEDPTIVRIAERIGRTPAQVALRWLVDKGIVAIPRARSAGHLQANLDLFGWELPAEDRAAIDAIGRHERYVSPPWARWD